MTKKQYNEDVIVKAMLAAKNASLACESFRKAYEIWEKDGKSKHMYPTPDLSLVLSGVVNPLFSPYQDLMFSANALYSARIFFDSLPRELIENDTIKRTIGDSLSREGNRLDDLLKSGDLAFSLF
ncbi:MAG: hypothetical protein AABW79_03565 [Nanoarchaeota archaeon]